MRVVCWFVGLLVCLLVGLFVGLSDCLFVGCVCKPSSSLAVSSESGQSALFLLLVCFVCLFVCLFVSFQYALRPTLHLHALRPEWMQTLNKARTFLPSEITAKPSSIKRTCQAQRFV